METIAQIYKSVAASFTSELTAQEEINRNLSTLVMDVNQAIIDINVNNLTTVSPEKIERYRNSINSEMMKLTARRTSFESFKARIANAAAFSTRPPIDDVSSETISMLDPEVSEKVTTLFAESQKFNQELIKNHEHLKELSSLNTKTVNALNESVDKLNSTLEKRSMYSYVAKSVLGFLGFGKSNELTNVISFKPVEPAFTPEAPAAPKKNTKPAAPVVVEEEAPVAEKRATRSSSKNTPPAQVAKPAPAPKKVAAQKTAAPVAKEAPAPVAEQRVLRSATKSAFIAPAPKKVATKSAAANPPAGKISREAKSLGIITTEDLAKALASKGIRTRSRG